MEVGGIKRSETADNLLGAGSNGLGGVGMGLSSASNSPRVSVRHVTSSPYMEPRRRPISQFVSDNRMGSDLFHLHSQKLPPGKKGVSSALLNPYPPPSNPAPPPPPRTISKTVEPIM